MKKNILLIVFAALLAVSCGSPARSGAVASTESDDAASVVYFTREITPASLVRIYEALGVEAKGRRPSMTTTGEMWFISM